MTATRFPKLHDPASRGFASDNYSGAHPEVLEALAIANGGHQAAYGEDAYTARLERVMRELLGETAQTFPVFNGTGANVIALQAMVPRWGAVICASTAHINVDENGAPERIAGVKLLTVPSEDGKLTPELIDREAWGWGDVHRAQPLAVSLSQTTELGTRYSVDEIAAIVDHAHGLGMKVHLDGSRLANATAALDVPASSFTGDLGIDTLSFGGTKNGLVFGECVVAFDPESAGSLAYLRKTDLQLASKMRFVSAQFLAVLEDGLWLRSAAHANRMAARLRAAVEGFDGVVLTRETDANSVFAILPEGVADRLREHFAFYDWDAARREVRWVCSFDTTEADVDAFAGALAAELTR